MSNPVMTDDNELDERRAIAAARTGDAAGIRWLYEQHRDLVYGVVRRLAGDDMSAEDWSQEAWVRVFRALPQYRGEARFGTWAYRIAVNVGLNGRRRSGREAARVVPLLQAGERSVPPERHALRMDLNAAIDGLPDGMRTVLVLHDIEGYTHEEIARQLDVAPGTCKSQLFKARAKLRAMLEPREETGEGTTICRT